MCTYYVFCGYIMAKKSNNIWNVLGIVGQLGFIIAIPAAALAYLGHILDHKFSTSPLFLIAGLGLAILLSSLAVYKMIKKINNVN